jgi:hypothetical protein
MCWGPEHQRDIRDAQEEIRLLFERYRGHPEQPVEPIDGDEEEPAREPEREYTLSSTP